MKTILAWIFASLLWGSLGIIILFLCGCMTYFEPLNFLSVLAGIIIFGAGTWGTAHLLYDPNSTYNREDLW